MSLEDRVAALENRLRAAEDQFEIMGLIQSYGPLVDCDEPQAAAHLWVEGGVHDVGGYPRRLAYDGIARAIGGPDMQALNQQGCTHFYATPRRSTTGPSSAPARAGASRSATTASSTAAPRRAGSCRR